MTATTSMRMTDFAGLVPARGTFPIAADTLILKGTQVALDSAGRAQEANTIANGAVTAIGRASATYDNRTGSVLGGSAGAVDVEVEYGVFEWFSAGGGDAIAADDVGKVCYMVDNQTVALTNDTDTRGLAGLITEVRGEKIFVWQGPHVAALIVIAASEASQLDTAQTDIDALQADALTAQACIEIPLNSFVVKSTGAPLVAFNDGVADGFDYIEGVGYRFNVASTAAIAAAVGLPNDLDDAAAIVLHVMGARVGASDTTAALTVEAFIQTVGAAYDADANAGGATTAFAAATTVVSEVTLSIAAGDVPAAPAVLSITLVPTAALDADDLRILRVWVEYTRKLLTA